MAELLLLFELALLGVELSLPGVELSLALDCQYFENNQVGFRLRFVFQRNS